MRLRTVNYLIRFFKGVIAVKHLLSILPDPEEILEELEEEKQIILRKQSENVNKEYNKLTKIINQARYDHELN